MADEIISYDKCITLAELEVICEDIFSRGRTREPLVLFNDDWVFRDIINK